MCESMDKILKKTEIFKEVVDIMRHDSSTCKDRSGGDVSGYLSRISDGMRDEDFLRLVCSYLGTFGVAGHVGFYTKNKSFYQLGFKVRRFGGALYIYGAAAESGVGDGERIILIDGEKISAAAEKFGEFLYGEPEERQGVFWRDILCFSRKITVCDNSGRLREAELKRGVKPSARSPFEFRIIDGQTALLRLDNFFDAAEIQKFIMRHDGEVREHDNLIIDVRENIGGTDAAFVCLLPYCLDFGVRFCDVYAEEDGEEINYSERTADLRIPVLEQYRNSAPKELQPLYDKIINEHKKLRGAGFAAVADGDCFDVTGLGYPRRVVVLTDCTCASSGESFVKSVAWLNKVTVVGRPTMGILDYSNVAEADFGDYIFVYPTSRSLSVDKGRGICGRGIGVDIPVAWSPEFLNSDPDLAAALEFLKISV